MRVSLASGPAGGVEADALAIAVSPDGLASDAAALGEAADVLAEVLQRGEHRGRLYEALPVRTPGVPGGRVLLYGVGDPAELDGQRLRWVHHQMVRAARGYGYRRLAVQRPDVPDNGSVAAIVEGAVMGAWDQRYLATGRPERGSLEELLLVGFEAGRQPEVDAAVQAGEATNQARAWVAAPANLLTPAALAEEALKIARRHGAEAEVLGPDELRAGGYNLIIAVGQGSSAEPRLVRLRHRGADTGRTLAIVGKGMTFDSGGLTLKKGEGMDKMKGDMAGAAAALAAFDVICARRLPVDVMCVIAAAENMTGASAVKPGDVITAAAGKTVEINNTDAEGRLILADAITHAIRDGATHIVDLATLTGAAEVALGAGASAALASDDDLWERVWEASERAGDRVWRLPVYADYRVLLRSSFADLKNGFYGQAGMITGGMFIQEFTEGRPWVHLDIAASSWNARGELTTIPAGPTGAGTRLLIHLAELFASSTD